MAAAFLLSALFPCWGKHQRMGHNTVVGEFRGVIGTSVVCVIPAVAGDERFVESPERTLVLPMDGPAFYGFEVITEADAREHLARSRPRSWAALALPSLNEDVVDADEMVDDHDLQQVATINGDDFPDDDLYVDPANSQSADAAYPVAESHLEGTGNRNDDALEPVGADDTDADPEPSDRLGFDHIFHR